MLTSQGLVRAALQGSLRPQLENAIRGISASKPAAPALSGDLEQLQRSRAVSSRLGQQAFVQSLERSIQGAAGRGPLLPGAVRRGRARDQHRSRSSSSSRSRDASASRAARTQSPRHASPAMRAAQGPMDLSRTAVQVTLFTIIFYHVSGVGGYVYGCRSDGLTA